MTYEEALAYLETFVNYEQTPRPTSLRQMTLDRMRRLCQRLGDPQRSFRSVLVGGTNGKGSICAMLYSMLRQTPLRAGLYVSPHLEDLRERIRVWGADRPPQERTHADDWIEPTAFADCVRQLQPHLEAMRKRGAEDTPTYFEVLTALAFLYFSQQRVEVAVVEVGLGGRLDATNVLQQAVSVLGPIGVDHVEVLGADPALIAREKGGIIKPRQTVVSAPQSDVVEDVLRVICEREGAPLLTCGRDLTAAVHRHDLRGLDITVTGLRGLYESLTIPLLGRHQAQNAVLAIGALEALSPTGIPHSVVERGLAQVVWPGRFEVVHEEPLVVMDGAHNPHAAAALRDALVELSGSRRIHLLVGMSADKSVEGLGETVGKLALSATCTKSRHPRALDPTVLAKRLSVFCPDVHVMSDAADAYTYLLNAVAPTDAIVVTGSLYLVGEVRSALRNANGRISRAVVATSKEA